MMRNKPVASMQKTYDDCYLICSTAVYFEGQNNETEALRCWKSALDQIYYHNANRLPSGYVPKSETERALFNSLREMEMQCKERSDFLEALKRSRDDLNKGSGDLTRRRLQSSRNSFESMPVPERTSSWVSERSIAPSRYGDEELERPPSLPVRPLLKESRSSEMRKVPSRNDTPVLGPPPVLQSPYTKPSRTPSPDHGRVTMRTTLRPEKRFGRSSRSAPKNKGPTVMKAAGLAWDTQQPRTPSQASLGTETDHTIEGRLSAAAARRSLDQSAYAQLNDQKQEEALKMPDPSDFIPNAHWRDPSDSARGPPVLDEPFQELRVRSHEPRSPAPSADLIELDAGPPTPVHGPILGVPSSPFISKTRSAEPPKVTKPPEISYRREYPPAVSKVPPALASHILDRAYNATPPDGPSRVTSAIHRKPVERPVVKQVRNTKHSKPSGPDTSESDKELPNKTVERPKRSRVIRTDSDKPVTPPSTDAESPVEDSAAAAWDTKVKALMKDLPKGVDENAAKQIMTEIVVKGDEVHWEDVAGLNAAKKALKEAVVYPFLRPDLFMGLREPARGMLLFGPPGTGKTMLARAVATESKSTFFAISASSLTSKWHGESEKLVRALFALAKALAPSIIFVDEIDSLLNTRSSSSEHEASRRSKTEFLIQWSDLQRAAAGRDTTIGDATRVLVLAATNCPWDIDEAARRRFVRRQYIPLPEAETRATQIRTLLGHQKHHLKPSDIEVLVQLTDGYSGSDITALAKDAAMGPLRNLGEALLYTPMDQIRPINMGDFEASLVNIRPSVSKKGLEAFETWARDYGERGG